MPDRIPVPIEERLPVWTALSELFLDTRLDESDLRRIAQLLRASPYDVAQLEGILRDEVSPAFSPNLLSVAGEWAGWSEAAVREIMTRSLARKPPARWLARLQERLGWRILPEQWREIAALLA